jgi:hypothetical protein
MMHSNVSYVDCFDDPGPHGTGRHMDHMLPEIPREDFRKGAQVCPVLILLHTLKTYMRDH